MSARRAARLTMRELGKLVGVHARTISRWELGETKPNAAEWAKLAAAIAPSAPDRAIALAGLVGVASPVAVPEPVDVRSIELALLHVADRLDVAPGRVRAAVRELLAAVSHARGSIGDLARAVQEPDAGAGGA